MQQAETIQLIPKVLIIFNRIIHFFGRPRISNPQPDQVSGNIDWPDSEAESHSRQPYHGNYKQPISDGYNEAFIVQYWASYHPRQ
jgi:hypothetical protein